MSQKGKKEGEKAQKKGNKQIFLKNEDSKTIPNILIIPINTEYTCQLKRQKLPDWSSFLKKSNNVLFIRDTSEA